MIIWTNSPRKLFAIGPATLESESLSIFGNLNFLSSFCNPVCIPTQKFIHRLTISCVVIFIFDISDNSFYTRDVYQYFLMKKQCINITMVTAIMSSGHSFIILVCHKKTGFLQLEALKISLKLTKEQTACLQRLSIEFIKKEILYGVMITTWCFFQNAWRILTVRWK